MLFELWDKGCTEEKQKVSGFAPTATIVSFYLSIIFAISMLATWLGVHINAWQVWHLAKHDHSSWGAIFVISDLMALYFYLRVCWLSTVAMIKKYPSRNVELGA